MDPHVETLALAVAHHRAGELAEAEQLYRRILSDHPRHADALHLLGLVYSDSGLHDAALPCLVRAIEASPQHAVFYSDLGLALDRAGRAREAIVACCKALELAPGDSRTLCRLAHILTSAGCLEEAAGVWKRLLEIEGHEPGILFQLANTLFLLGRFAEAEPLYAGLADLYPDHAEVRYNHAVALMALGRLQDARQRLEETLRLKPDHCQALNNLAVVLQELGRAGEAEAACRAAIALRSDYPEARYNYGLLLREQGRFEEAAAQYEAVLDLDPGHIEARNNLGVAWMALGRYQEAMAAHRAVIARNPNHAEAHWNLGFSLLLHGDFDNGWEEHEWRLKMKTSPPREFPRPRWSGEPFGGGTLLIWAEQGLGDTLQFIRYARLAKERGGRVLVECQPSLIGLLSQLGEVDEWVAHGERLPEFDLHIPLLSLPRVFATGPGSIPPPAPLQAGGERAARWRSRIADAGGCKIGIVWGGNAGHKAERYRGVPLAKFTALADVPGVSWFSLQRGPQASQLLAAPPSLRIQNLEDGPADIRNTAGMIANLDLVVTTDTMLAHLAGSMRKPVWTLLAFAPDWRWMLNRSDSPWYPTMRLFRQPAPGDWDAVFGQLRKALDTATG